MNYKYSFIHIIKSWYIKCQLVYTELAEVLRTVGNIKKFYMTTFVGITM